MTEDQFALVITGSIIVLALVVRKLLKARKRMRLFGETFREAIRRPKPIRNKVDLTGNKPTPEARRKTSRLKQKYKPEVDYEPWEDGIH